MTTVTPIPPRLAPLPPYFCVLLHTLKHNPDIPTYQVAKLVGREMHSMRYRRRLRKLEEMGYVKSVSTLCGKGVKVRKVLWSLTDQGYMLTALPYDSNPKRTQLLSVVLGVPKTAYYIAQLLGERIEKPRHSIESSVRTRLGILCRDGYVTKTEDNLWAITPKGLEWLNGKHIVRPIRLGGN